MALMLCALFLLMSAGLLILARLQTRRRELQVARRLQGHMVADTRLSDWITVLGQSRLAQRSVSLDSETERLLNRIGWRRASRRSLYAALQIGTPVVLMVLVLMVQALFFKQLSQPWLAPCLALGIGYILPKRILAMAAKRRGKQIAVEVSSFIPLLRILFESGLAVEQTLRVLSSEGEQLLPILSGELRLVLARVDSGLELGEELDNAAAVLDVDEFNDTCVILRQLVYQGAGAMKSLLALKQLLDDRRLTRMQEYISKMSAKMSVVMMLFLFPALLIVLAGPGFIAIGQAFKSL